MGKGAAAYGLPSWPHFFSVFRLSHPHSFPLSNNFFVKPERLLRSRSKSPTPGKFFVSAQIPGRINLLSIHRLLRSWDLLPRNPRGSATSSPGYSGLAVIKICLLSPPPLFINPTASTVDAPRAALSGDHREGRKVLRGSGS